MIVEWVKQTQKGEQPKHNHWRKPEEYVWEKVQRERAEGRAIYKGRRYREWFAPTYVLDAKGRKGARIKT